MVDMLTKVNQADTSLIMSLNYSDNHNLLHESTCLTREGIQCHLLTMVIYKKTTQQFGL